MRLPWFIAIVLAVTLVPPSPAVSQEREGLQPPSRGQHKRAEDEAERDRMLDVAQQLRSKAGSLHDRADELRQKGRDDEAGKFDDQAEALENQAATMEEAADEIMRPLDGVGGHRPHGRPQRD